MEIDANGIKITAKPFKITADDYLNNIYTIQDSIIDKLFQALDKEKMMRVGWNIQSAKNLIKRFKNWYGR